MVIKLFKSYVWCYKYFFSCIFFDCYSSNFFKVILHYDLFSFEIKEYIQQYNLKYMFLSPETFDKNGIGFSYYINDGVYGSFNIVLNSRDAPFFSPCLLDKV